MFGWEWMGRKRKKKGAKEEKANVVAAESRAFPFLHQSHTSICRNPAWGLRQLFSTELLCDWNCNEVLNFMSTNKINLTLAIFFISRFYFPFFWSFVLFCLPRDSINLQSSFSMPKLTTARQAFQLFRLPFSQLKKWKRTFELSFYLPRLKYSLSTGLDAIEKDVP